MKDSLLKYAGYATAFVKYAGWPDDNIGQPTAGAVAAGTVHSGACR